MAVDGGSEVHQYYCVVLSDKSTGREGVKKAKGAAIVRLLRSVRCQRTVLQCREPDDKLWLEDVLRHAELTSAKFGQGVNDGPSHHDVNVLIGEDDSSAERCKLIVNVDVPEELSYMRSLIEADCALPTHAIVTFVTPPELVTLKNFTQPNPEWKIKPLPEVLPGLRHDVDEDQQRSSAQPSCMPEGLAAGSMHTDRTSEEAAQGQEKPQSAEEELQIRKQRLLHTLGVLGSQQTGSLQPAATPATSQSGQNGHGHVNQEDSIEDEVPPPPLGSPRASQAIAAANTGTLQKAGLHEASKGAALQGQQRFPTQPAAVELDTPPSAFPAASEFAEGGERRTRQRSAQDAAARKEEQQELALERAILEIHWRQAAENGQDDWIDGEAGDMAEDEELEEGELTSQEPAAAEDQSMAAAGPALVWHEHLPPFYHQWGRLAGAGKSRAAEGAQAADASAAAHAEPTSQAAAWDEWYRQQGYGGQAADAGAGTGAGASVQASAWEEWYRQQGYIGQDAPAQQVPGISGDGAAAGVWEQWRTWQQQQQQQQGSGAGSAADWGSWPAGSQPRGASSWAAQGMQGPDKEGFVSVPVALVQRYQMLEWAEWCRQYERWQAAYEQWYTWWTSMMWQSSAHYGASTEHNAGAS